MIEPLKEHLEEGKDWEKLETEIPGVFVVKIPATKTRSARLMVEVNPVDETGKPKKRKGLFISDFAMYVQFLETLNDDRIGKLIKIVDQVNPTTENGGKKKLLKID
ncbi:MAG: hypothetical protein Kow0069_34350 [Promethearchaeota archaeon]